MSPGLSLRGPNDFKPHISTREAAAFRPLSSRSVAQGSGPQAFVNRSSPASQCLAQGSPLQANAPRSSAAFTGHTGPPPEWLLRPWAVACTQELRDQARLCWRPGSAPPGRGGGEGPLPPHSSRTQTSGCWALGVYPPPAHGHPPLRVTFLEGWRQRLAGAHSPRCSMSHEICLRLPPPRG